MRKIKLLLIIDTLGRGGAEGQVYELVKHLDKRRYQLVVCSLTNRGEYIEEIEKRGVKVVTLARSFRELPGAILKLMALLHRERFDVVHNMMFVAGLFGTTTASLLRVPVIINSVRSLGFTRRRHRRTMKRIIYKIGDCVVVNSRETKSLLVAYRIVKNDKIHVVYNGVDLRLFHPDSNGYELLSKRKELGLRSEGFPVIGMVANLSPVKNHRCLLKAIPIILQDFPKAVFLIIGDGPLRHDLEKAAANLKVNGNLLFLGRRNDIPELLRLMDLSILCSFREGFSNAILESMATGKCVIASDVGGNSEAIVDGVTGFLFNPYDHEQLANKIIQILKNRDLLQQMGAASRKRAEELFDVRRMLQAYEDLYQSLLTSKVRARSLTTPAFEP